MRLALLGFAALCMYGAAGGLVLARGWPVAQSMAVAALYTAYFWAYLELYVAYVEEADRRPSSIHVHAYYWALLVGFPLVPAGVYMVAKGLGRVCAMAAHQVITDVVVRGCSLAEPLRGMSAVALVFTAINGALAIYYGVRLWVRSRALGS